MANGKKMGGDVLFIVFVLILLSLAIVLPISKAANINGANYRNVTVRTSVNISNSKPEVLSVIVYQESNLSLKNITLSAGADRIVTCNASLRDWNGYSDIGNVTGVLWGPGAGLGSADDNSTHYTNANCSNAGNGVNFTVSYTCNFSVYYYANNGTWNCSVTAIDTFAQNASLINTTIIYPLYALNVTDGIDYGSVAVEEYSANVTANVTNLGNRPINVTVEGYGLTRGDKLAMNCSLGGNITVANERFSTTDVDWDSKTPLNGTPQTLPSLTIQKQTQPDTQMTNVTYWQLFVNSSNNPGGNCTGYITFMAQLG